MKLNKIGLIVASGLLLAGCQSQSSTSTSEPTTTEASEMTLEVTVTSVDNDYVLVSDNQTQQEFAISMEIFNEETYASMVDTLNTNDILSVTYNGGTTRSIPAQFAGITNIAFVEDVEEPEIKTQSFTATVTSVDEDYIVLNADDDSTVVYGEVWVDRNSVDTEASSPMESIVADVKVNVEFSGMVTMSLPPQLGGVVVITVAE